MPYNFKKRERTRSKRPLVSQEKGYLQYEIIEHTVGSLDLNQMSQRAFSLRLKATSCHQEIAGMRETVFIGIFGPEHFSGAQNTGEFEIQLLALSHLQDKRSSELRGSLSSRGVCGPRVSVSTGTVT